MDLSQLRALGAVVTAPPVRKPVSWQPTDPETGAPVGAPVTFDVYIRKPSSGWLDRARSDALLSSSGRSYRAAIIAHAVVFGEKQDQSWSYDEAFLLQDSLSEALYDAYLAVNQPPPAPVAKDKVEDDFAKNTEPTPGSGTNSSEPASADAP